MNSKRWVSIAIILVFVLMTACSSKGSNSSPEASIIAASPKTEASSEPTSEATPAPVTITVWDKISDEAPNKALGQELQDGFKEKYPNITVNHIAGPNGENARQVFMTAMAGGDGPDLYTLVPFPTIGDWVKAGYIQDLTEYWNSYEDKDQFLPSAMQQATIDGKVYGVPIGMYIMGLIYNKDLYTEAGLDPNTPPKDWDEFAKYAQALTKPDKQQFGYSLLGMDWADWFFEYYVWQAGGDLTTKNADGTITLDFTKEPTVKALQYWSDLKWKYKVVQSNVAQGFDDNKKDFFQKRSAMMLGASESFGEFAANGLDLNSIGFAPLPVGPSGKAPSQMGGTYAVINPKISKEKQDAAWKYITYNNSKEALEKALKFQADNGIMPNLLTTRKDVNPTDFAKEVPQELVLGVQKAAESTQLEYAMKERLSPYIVRAIQKALLEEKTNIPAVLKEAEDTAQREIVDPYNAEIKK